MNGSTMADDDPSVEDAKSFWPQFISMAASVTAGLSSILASRLDKRYPLSFHSTSPVWSMVLFAILAYSAVYLAFVLYVTAIFTPEQEEEDGLSLSATLALMAAPGVPLHGFLWAAIPQKKTFEAREPPASDGYIEQCFARKHWLLLFLSITPLFAAAVAAAVFQSWQAMSLQIAVGVAFLATSNSPEASPRARESAFGRAGRFMLVPRPGSRMDTIGYCVDLHEATLLPPVRVDMTGVSAYQEVETRSLAASGLYVDDETATTRPVVIYLTSLTANLPTEKLADMTNQLWKTLEQSKLNTKVLSMDLFFLLGLCERMAYVAFRPGTPEERKIATTLNFAICRADYGAQAGSERQCAAKAIVDEWREEGEKLVRSNHWKRAYALAGVFNKVDKPVPKSTDLLGEDMWTNSTKRDVVEALGAVLYLIRIMVGHVEPAILSQAMDAIPFYHNRIWSDLNRGGGSIPILCRGIISSMAGNGMVGRIDGHEWASGASSLQWGGGGYALLDQAYARSSAIAYVGQLAIIIVKAVLQG